MPVLHHEFIRNFQIVPRDYEFEEDGNYVLVGLRRAGKSTLLYKIVLDLVTSACYGRHAQRGTGNIT